MSATKIQVKGFNAGYKIEKYVPALSTVLRSSLSSSKNEYAEAFVAGGNCCVQVSHPRWHRLLIWIQVEDFVVGDRERSQQHSKGRDTLVPWRHQNFGNSLASGPWDILHFRSRINQDIMGPRPLCSLLSRHCRGSRRAALGWISFWERRWQGFGWRHSIFPSLVSSWARSCVYATLGRPISRRGRVGAPLRIRWYTQAGVWTESKRPEYDESEKKGRNNTRSETARHDYRAN